MSSTANKHPIEVGILEISSQNRAILEFFFSGAGKSYFKEVALDKASAYIIDYDSLGAKESWESIFEDTKKPGIIISIKEVDLPSTIWLPKPLTVKALKDAGESIREMMLNEVSPEPVATIIEDKEIAVTEEIVESIISPQEKVTQKEAAKISPVFIEDIIDIPSEPLAPIAHQNDILEELDIVAEVQDTKADAVSQEATLDFDDELISLIEETAEAPKENLLAVEMIEKVSTIGSVMNLTKEKPELAIADTKDSASSSSFAASSDFIDIDLSLDNCDENLDEETTEKSSTTPIEKPVILNSDEENEIDSLLETLISGGKSSEKADKLSKSIVDDSADLAGFETVELKTVESETEAETKAEEVNDLPESIITDTKVFEDDNKVEINKVIHEDGNTEEEEKKTAEDELQSLLEEIRQEADGTTTTEGNSQIVKKYAPTNAEERWKLICGDDNADLQRLGVFNPSNHLVTTLSQNIKTTRQSKKVSRMKFNGIIVVIDPETDRIYCDQSIFTEYYANICYEPMPQEKIKVHQLDKSEIRLYRKKMDENTELTHYTEAFLWTASLLTSRGRLPKNTNMKNKIGLTAWPNLTRVEKIPHMMQIAALFNKNTWSLSELTTKSGIQKNYVTAFYNAALALDMIQTNGEVTDSVPLNLKTSNNNNRSFLSRFLKKLTA